MKGCRKLLSFLKLKEVKQSSLIAMFSIIFLACSETTNKLEKEEMKSRSLEIRKTDSILIKKKYIVDSASFVPHEHYEFEQ